MYAAVPKGSKGVPMEGTPFSRGGTLAPTGGALLSGI